MTPTSSTADVAANVLRGALRHKQDPYPYDKAYQDAFADEFPAPSVGTPAFEAAIGLLIGTGLVAAKAQGLVITSLTFESIDSLITTHGGWIQWYREFGQFAVDYDSDDGDDDDDIADAGATGEGAADAEDDNGPARDAPTGVKERTIADAVVARASGYPTRWSIPSDFKVPRKTLTDAVSIPFIAFVIGLIGIVIAPFAIVAAVVWMPFAAVIHTVQRARGRV